MIRAGEARLKIKPPAELVTVAPRWTKCVVAASGPSLDENAARSLLWHLTLKGLNDCGIIAVNDAYRLIPFAHVLYGCDAQWWDLHKGCPDFQGEKWSSHSEGPNEKRATAAEYGLTLVRGQYVDGFSLDSAMIHYGGNSGFQGVNLAILFGAKKIILVGFDMQPVGGKRHFFGDHPAPLNNSATFSSWIAGFTKAAKDLPDSIEIVNCTPNSALRCFRMGSLEEEL